MAINANPIAIKIPRLSPDVAPLYNRIPPTSPRNSVAMPWMQTARTLFPKRLALVDPLVSCCCISGKKTPESNAKNASR